MIRSAFRTALILSLTAAGSSAQQALFDIQGHLSSDYFGFDVAGGGDVDADGVPDVVAGGYRGDFTLGLVRVVSGATGQTIHSFTGQPGDGIGSAVAFVGDLDADGHEDIAAVGLWGGTWVWSGATGSLIHFLPSFGGVSLDGIGDVDGDSVPDIMVSAQIWSGATGLQIRTLVSAFNHSVVGDVNGDGVMDYAAFDSNHTGVYSSFDNTLLLDFPGYAAWATGAGDVNADGVDDVLVSFWSDGSTIFSGANGAVIYSYPLLGAFLEGSPEVAGVGDVDSDGHDDFLLARELFSGESGCRLAVFETPHSYSVAGTGDLNGDGLGDIIIGSPLPLGQGGVGQAFVFAYDGPTGTNYCAANPTSQGAPSRMIASGGTGVAANKLSLQASHLEAGQPGLFYYGPAQTQVPFGAGFRCVAAGALGTFRLPVETANENGCLVHPLDITAQSSAPGIITGGSTWNFQAWFRDPSGGAPFFNLSDGLSIFFLP